MNAQELKETEHLTIKNKVISAHYSTDELNQIRENDPLKFKTIIYYYTGSFEAELINCNECVTADLSSLDVSEFEHFRKKSERVTKIKAKSGVKITLLSTDELKYKLPIHQ